MMIMKKIVEIFILISFLKFSTAQLEASNVTEGACIVPQLAQVINPFWFLARRTYFIPVASEYCFRNYAEVLLGRPSNDTVELERMCLKVFVSGMNARTYGYNRVIVQSCSLTQNFFRTFNPGQLTCRVDNASPGTRTSLFDEYMDNVVMTDNRNFAVYVRCVNGTRDYKVLSVVPEIPESLFAQIRAKIASLGFNPDLIRRLTCNGATASI